MFKESLLLIFDLHQRFESRSTSWLLMIWLLVSRLLVTSSSHSLSDTCRCDTIFSTLPYSHPGEKILWGWKYHLKPVLCPWPMKKLENQSKIWEDIKTFQCNHVWNSKNLSKQWDAVLHDNAYNTAVTEVAGANGVVTGSSLTRPLDENSMVRN